MSTAMVQRLPHGMGLPLPSYATQHAAGLDLPAAVTSDLVVGSGERVAVPTGFMMAIPHGFEAQIRPRSGLALKNGITVLNSPGTIDADYRGEVMVILINLSGEPFTITRGMRIAQMVIAPVTRISLMETEQLETSARGTGGFGSTGT